MKYAVPSKLSALRHGLRRTEQHRRVPVVAAGVHPALVPGGVGDAGFFVDVQRIEVGAQPNGARRRAVAQHPDDAGPGQARMDLEPEAAQLVRHERAGRGLLERGFGMRVDVVAPVAHGGIERGDFGQDVHGSAARVSGASIVAHRVESGALAVRASACHKGARPAR